MQVSRIMAPNHHFMMNSLPLEPVSRTYQYRKIMKPMLERKRRARINKCLDELKDLMTGTLQTDGENVSKLEKADILELTVRHLHRLRENNALFLRTNETLNVDKFWAGFQHCASEISQFLGKYDHNVGGDLIKHIASYVPNMVSALIATSPTANAANYQRFCTAMCEFPSKTATVKEPTTETPIAGMHISEIPCVAAKSMLDPYGRAKMEVDGRVWRPW